MKYYKNVELAERYRISEGTVRNWIKMAKDGRLDLVLHREGRKAYVAKVISNETAIEQLVEANRKYRNGLALKTVEPKPEFYRTFTEAQVYDIVRSLEAHHEIPRQYNYFDGGAREWDVYTQHLASERSQNLLTGTIGLLADNQSYLDKRLAGYKHVNVVDVGPGNSLPVKELLGHLIEQGKLDRYIAIDISASMLDIAERNIKEWFGDRVRFERYELDVTHERFANILAEDYLKKNSNDRCNLILFLGGTAHNFRNPDDAFRTIHESMNLNDLLLYTERLETDDMRPEWFDRDATPGKIVVTPRHRLVFDLLNIQDSFYDAELGFDQRRHLRYSRVRFKVSVTLKFKFAEFERTITFEKGDAILLWRSWQITDQNFIQQFTRNDFYVLHSSQTADHEYILTISQVRCE